jgi:nucleoside 2-deoxyribosyltransferase
MRFKQRNDVRNRSGGQRKMKRVYLASPFFNDKEIGYLEQVEEILAEKGLKVFSPMRKPIAENVEVGSRQWSIETFMDDIKHIKWAEIVVGIYHGNYSDSGTAWEFGYAYATDKPVILVHVGENSNLMVHEGAHANITLEKLKEYDFDELASSFYTGEML